jgi:hypothetical protein
MMEAAASSKLLQQQRPGLSRAFAIAERDHGHRDGYRSYLLPIRRSLSAWNETIETCITDPAPNLTLVT